MDVDERTLYLIASRRNASCWKGSGALEYSSYLEGCPADLSQLAAFEYLV